MQPAVAHRARQPWADGQPVICLVGGVISWGVRKIALRGDVERGDKGYNIDRKGKQSYG